jgi:Zn-finger nucleic acid-binding protein
VLRKLTTIEDDRGRAAPLLQASGFADWPIARDPRMALLLGQIQAVVAKRSTRHLSLIVVVSCVLGAGVAILTPFFTPLVTGAAIGISIIVVGIVAAFWHSARAARGAGPDVAALMLREGLCPSCGYNFAGLTPAEDHCIVCPECGAAWLASRIERAIAFDQTGESMTVSETAIVLTRGFRTRTACLDDRGRPASLARPRLRSALRAASPELRLRLLAARRDYSLRSLVLRGTAAGACVAAVVFLAWLHLRLLPWITWAPIVLLATGLAYATGIFFSGIGYSAGRIIPAMKREGLCPSCASDLRMLPIEDDGCCICPTCLAAWRISSAAAPPPQAPAATPPPAPRADRQEPAVKRSATPG